MKTADEVIQKWTREFLLENPVFVHNGYSVVDILEWLAKKQLASQFTPSPKEISEEEMREKLIKHLEVPSYMKDDLYWELAIESKSFVKFCLSLPFSGSKTEAVELPEDIQDFIDGIERIKAQVKNGKYSYAEKTKQELINKLNDIV